MDLTASLRWRDRGNLRYQQASLSNIPGDKLNHYAAAMHYFNKALDEACGDVERSSALKNKAMSICRQVEIIKEMKRLRQFIGKPHSSTSEISYQNALKCFSAAIACKGTNMEWRLKLRKDMKTCLENAICEIDKLGTPQEKITALYTIMDIIADPEFNAHCCTQLAVMLIGEGVKNMKKGDYKAALDLFRESYSPIQQAKNNCESQTILDLENDVKQKSRIAEARHAVHTGTDFLEKTQKEKDINCDELFCAIDSFREAIMITNEKEFEIEAMALAYIGKSYEVLQQPLKAKDLYMRSIQLTESMPNQSFVLQEWYVTCQAALQKLQGEKVEKEEMNKRTIVKEHLQKEMKILQDGRDKHRGDIPNLLCYISEKLPPSKWSFALPSLDELKFKSLKDLKSITRKVVLAYHTDHKKMNDKVLKVLNEEITKVLNGILESIKAQD